MGVSRDCYINAYYCQEGTKRIANIFSFKDEPDKWSQSKEEYWNTIIEFYNTHPYYYKDYFLLVGYKSSDYGLHHIELYKNGEKILNIETDDYKSYNNESVEVYDESGITIIYRKDLNHFWVEIAT